MATALLRALAGGTGVILVFFWRLALYNSQHQAIYFLRSTRPVWNYDGAFIRETLYAIGVAGVPAFASVGLYLAGLASLWLWIKHWKSTPVMARNTLVFAALGGLAYSLLWFRMLREHDYYLICLLAIPVILLLNGYRLAASRHPLQGLPYALGVCLLIGGWHNRYILSERLRLAFHPQNSLSLPPDAFLAPGRLEAAGVPEAARVLCPQDPSPTLPCWLCSATAGRRITAATGSTPIPCTSIRPGLGSRTWPCAIRRGTARCTGSFFRSGMEKLRDGLYFPVKKQLRL
ncbi:MAG: hypothetical protein IPH12_05675 [Saprospirales bacterium]|nr:hypothetical protein [Saprospirales bacterium]